MDANLVGVCAFSKHRNYITFWGIDDDDNYNAIGDELLYRLSEIVDLNAFRINCLILNEEYHIKQSQYFYSKGFSSTGNTISENGITGIIFDKS